MKEYKLTQPIMAYGNEVFVIELKEPTVKDIKKLGFPFDAGMVADPKKIAAYITELGNLPPSSVEQLEAYDFLMLTQFVILFFGPKQAMTEPETEALQNLSQ